MSTRRTNIVDVARAAGTSTTSVSNLLNGRSSSMSAETAARIRRAMSDLDFRPSSTARALVRNRTALIGLLVSEIDSGLFLNGIAEWETRASEHGFGILIASSRGVAGEARALDLFIEKQTDGVVFLSTSSYRSDDHIRKAVRAGVPLVLVNRAQRHDDMDQVDWDNGGGVAALVEYLVRLGHRRIAHLYGPADRLSTDSRLEGYRAGLARAGIEADPDLAIRTDYESEPSTWVDAALALMRADRPPTAVITADDVVAGTVMRGLQDAGYGVPGDISVVGIDDQPFARYLGLTTMQLPVREAGLLAIDLIVRRIKEPASRPEHRVLECPLVTRSTSAPPREAS